MVRFMFRPGLIVSEPVFPLLANHHRYPNHISLAIQQVKLLAMVLEMRNSSFSIVFPQK